MSSTFDHFTSRVILVASLTAKPGLGDEVQRLLTNIHKFSNSRSEPGCLVFRTSRSGDLFNVYEEYTDKNAITQHFETEGFKALGAANVLVGTPTLKYYEEFKSSPED
ncbi:hypothetical protein M0805_003793 [Coniferiporia weirii]|nr:hypothetical protein M0805_003793 [Coniferiporia weirii]